MNLKKNKKVSSTGINNFLYLIRIRTFWEFISCPFCLFYFISSQQIFLINCNFNLKLHLICIKKFLHVFFDTFLLIFFSLKLSISYFCRYKGDFVCVYIYEIWSTSLTNKSVEDVHLSKENDRSWREEHLRGNSGDHAFIFTR